MACEAEDFLRGQPASDEMFVRAGQIAAAHCSPAADPRGPVDRRCRVHAQSFMAG